MKYYNEFAELYEYNMTLTQGWNLISLPLIPRINLVRNVFDEIKEIKNQGYKSILFVDDNFLANKKRAHQIFDRLIEDKLDLELLITGARVDSASKNLYRILLWF